jgi:putative restriction endonuclease
MQTTLTKPELLRRLLDAATAGGYQTIITARQHPFGLRIFKPEETEALKVRAYIWNCTHGGNNRAADEYRVQLTGVVPQIASGEQTVLLGWHEDYQVFVAFDITKHAGQASASPSIQVKENILLAAHTKAFSAYERANGEIAVAFRPEFFPEYVKQAPLLHDQRGAIGPYLEALNDVAQLTESDVAAITKPERREVLATIRKKVREQDFRARVLRAYGDQCAMCGVQLRLIEAAHILPVAEPTSTDETANGIALCSLHHDAYDRNLISFSDSYRIETSGASEQLLRADKLLGGLAAFKAALRPAILLPADRRDHPRPDYIRRSREVRRWRA